MGAVDHHQWCRRLHQLFREAALAGEQLLGEVVRAGHDILRLGQLRGERYLGKWHLRRHGLDGVDPGLDRLNDGLLARADRVKELCLQVPSGIAGHSLYLPVRLLCACKLYQALTIPSKSAAYPSLELLEVRRTAC